MMKFKLLAFLGILFLLTSCGSKKPLYRPKKKPHHREVSSPFPNSEQQERNIEELPNPLSIKTPAFKSDVAKYIYRYNPVAKEEMQTYGIPASITLAQGILESDAGRAELTRKSNNHFGIKCHGWQGQKVYHDDDLRHECFRKYKNPNYSFRDHSLFLTTRNRYSRLFDLAKDDYKGWARGLKRAGYATDPAYPRKLIGIIERYELYKYDRQVLEHQKSATEKQMASAEKEHQETREETAETSVHSHRVYVVQQGDTLYSIAKRFGLSVSDLKEQNDLPDNTISIGQELNVGR